MRMDVFQGTQDPRFDQCARIREIVFFYEQNVPRERDFDGLDAGATQYLFWHNGVACGTARSRVTDGKVKIERFALLPDVRGLGMGAEAFRQIVADCREQNPGAVIEIGAQAYLQKFYEKIGFIAKGELFQDAGIDHIHMEYTL